MMKILFAVAALTLGAGAAFAQPAQPAAQTQTRLTVDSPLSALMGDPRTRPVMDRHLPNFAANPLYDMVKDFSFRQFASSPHVQGINDQVLANIDAELASAQSSPAQPAHSAGH